MSTNDQLMNPYELGGCVYYAQNREDLILESFFSDIKQGFYVDVGAFDPDYDSVTKLFYKKGWHGINIEPQLSGYEAFRKRRKRDVNLNIGIADKRGTLTLRAYKSAGLSTFSDSVKQTYEKQPDQDTKEYTERTVEVHPLREVLAEQKVKHIHFMKVDVEGLEHAVLASNDWQRFRPEVLCIEANHIEKDWHPILRKAGYELVFDDGLNEYFVDKHTDRKQKFDYVENVIHEHGGGIKADHLELMMDWQRLALEKTHHVEELVSQKKRLENDLNKTNDQIRAYEIRMNSIRITTKQLLRLLKRRLRGS